MYSEPSSAAAAKSLQSCLTLQPHRQQPTRLLCLWGSPGKNTGVGCHFLFQCMKVKSESEVAQSCPTLRDPLDCSLPGSSIHGIFQARIQEWVAISFSNAWKWKVKVKLLSHVWLLATPWTIAYQAPPSMGFSRQEYWSGVPFLSPLAATTGFILLWNALCSRHHITHLLSIYFVPDSVLGATDSAVNRANSRWWPTDGKQNK